MPDETQGVAARASGRARGDMARVRDVRLSTGQSVLAGLFIGWVGIATKAAINEAIGANTGYIVLMAAAVLAAWFGGLAGGITAVVTAVVLNSVIFQPAGGPSSVDQFLQVLYLVTATATAMLVASRRAARDRLEDALAEVSALAEEVEARDARLELMLAASGTGFWEWDVETGQLTWSEAIFRQHGLEPQPAAPPYAAYLDMLHPDDRATFEGAIGGGPGRLGRVRAGLPRRVAGRGGALDAWRGPPVPRRPGAGGTDDRHGPGHHRPATSHRGPRPAHRGGAARGRIPRGIRRCHQPRAADADHHDPRADSDPGPAGPDRRRCVADGAARGRPLRVGAPASAGRGPARPESRRAWPARHRGRAARAAPIAGAGRRPRGARAAEHHGRRPDLEPDLPIVAGEATYVEQIVRNLLDNAAKYTPPGSHVVVSARTHDGARRGPCHATMARASRRNRSSGSSSSSTATRHSSRAVAGSGHRAVRVRQPGRGDGRPDLGRGAAGRRLRVRLHDARTRA